jgi:hypothetical protein
MVIYIVRGKESGIERGAFGSYRKAKNLLAKVGSNGHVIIARTAEHGIASETRIA